MANTATLRPAAGLSASIFANVPLRAVATLRAWNDARVTRNELSKLTERELDDIGLTFGDIEDIAARNYR